MYGLEAITANNGWAMAAAGAIIVLMGLSVLSFIISRLHKIIDFAENKAGTKTKPETPGDTVRALGLPEHMPDDIHAVAEIYKSISLPLAAPFELQRLYQLSVENNLPHPHISLSALRASALLVPDGEGRFSWSL